MTLEPFPKLARLSRRCIISEKIDGTNGQLFITAAGITPESAPFAVGIGGGLTMYAGSRNRWLTPSDDNHGFARWAVEHQVELMQLGPGRHFGEWYGTGIGRGYGLKEKRFALFNTTRWAESRPACCDVVPVLFDGLFSTNAVENALTLLRLDGSHAVPGWKRPEGVVVFHVAGNVGFKKTLEHDDEPKTKRA
jgi:hypothetical protein